MLQYICLANKTVAFRCQNLVFKKTVLVYSDVYLASTCLLKVHVFSPFLECLLDCIRKLFQNYCQNSA